MLNHGEVRAAGSGKLIQLVESGIPRGGQGLICRVVGDDSLLAKIYDDPSTVEASKLRAMVASPPAGVRSGGSILIAWPVEVLETPDLRRQVIGFTMPRAVELNQLISVYNPKLRQKLSGDFASSVDARFLVRTARNLSASFESLHAAGHVVGDVKQQNALVSARAVVTLVDADSFQFRDPVTRRVYECPVLTPEYCPPESLAAQPPVFSEHHDRFGLAVLIFLLLQGVHPYSGGWIGSGPPPELPDAIRGGHFPYCTKRNPLIVPPRHGVRFDTLPESLIRLFRDCFERGHSIADARPSATVWKRALTVYENELIECRRNGRHLFGAHLQACPWCAAAADGVDLLPPLPAARQVVAPPPQPVRRVSSPTQRPAPAIPRRRIRQFAALVSLAVALILVAYGLTSMTQAPEQVVEAGVCPGEGCTYGEKWKTLRAVDLYLSPPNAVAIPVSSLTKQSTLPAGVWVTTNTGMVVAKRRDGVVSMSPGRSPYGSAGAGGPPLKNGQSIPIYSYLGEGCWSAWIRGRMYPICDVTPQGSSENQGEWWVQVTTPTGAKAWTNGASEAFVSEEGLNSELGELLADERVPRERKLVEVDSLLKRGASLNGSGGKYGTTPVEGAIRSNDPVMVAALVQRGLNLRSKKPCIASFATISALRPGGDRMIDWLLENGMDFECLWEPPFQAFLRSGMATDSYPVKDAVRVARVLIHHGIPTSGRDVSGATVLDLVNQQRNRQLLGPLRQLLENPAAAASANRDTGLSATASGLGAGASIPDSQSVVERLLLQAEAYIDAGNYERAASQSERALALAPTSERARAMVQRIGRIRSVLR